MYHELIDFIDLMKYEDLSWINLRIYVKVITAKMKRIEIITDHNKTQTHFIQMANSHWHLRLSHWPLTQHSSWPLWLYLIMTNISNLICRVQKQLCKTDHIIVRNTKQNWLWFTKWFWPIRCCMICEWTDE